MTAHPFIARRLARPAQPADGDSHPEIDATLVRDLERVADGLPLDRTPLRRLTVRRLAHRHPLSRLDLPLVGDLTPKGRAALDLVYSRRSRLALALLGDPTP